MDTYNIAIIYDRAEFEQELSGTLTGDEGYKILVSAKLDNKTLSKIEYKSPDIIIIYTEETDIRIVDLIERLYITKSGCAILVITTSTNVKQANLALEAGANKVLAAPIDTKLLKNSIMLSVNKEKSRLTTDNVTDKATFLSKTISIFGTKGGVGKTTLAVNLAVALARKRKKVAIIDLDLQFGDVGIFLDIDKADTISELLEENNDPDINAIKGYMPIHSTGISVLLAPKSPEYAELIKGKQVEKIINNLKDYFDYVIIDMPPAFNDISLVALENSSAVLFVTNLDISSLKNTKVSFNIISSLGFLQKVKLIFNKDGISSIKPKEAKKILNKDIYSVVENDNKVAVNALNRGIPIVIDSPKSVLSAAVNTLANKILEDIK